MKIKTMRSKILASIAGLLVSLISPLAVLVPQVAAATLTWDGGGSDNNWSTAENWSGSSPELFSITVEGNPITLTGDITGDQEEGTVILDISVNLGSNVEYSVPRGAVRLGSFGTSAVVNVNSYNLTFSTPAIDCRYININSGLNGSGNIVTATGAAAVNLIGSGLGFSGDVVVNGEGLSIAQDALLM